MPRVTVRLEEGDKTFNVEEGTRLVLALENNGVDISHRCGGNARCTTCRCSFESGEPDKMTKAEKERLQSGIEKGDEQLKTARLSCQIPVNQDMVVKPLMRVKDSDWDQPGGKPEPTITPKPEWIH